MNHHHGKFTYIIIHYPKIHAKSAKPKSVHIHTYSDKATKFEKVSHLNKTFTLVVTLENLIFKLLLALRNVMHKWTCELAHLCTDIGRISIESKCQKLVSRENLPLICAAFETF